MITRVYLNNFLFNPAYEVTEGLKLIDRIISLCTFAINASLPIFYNDNLFLLDVVTGIKTSSLLKSEKERKVLLSPLVQKFLHFETREDPNSLYTCSHETLPNVLKVNGTVLPDAYEHSYEGQVPLLINLSENFPHLSIDVYKNEDACQKIFSCHTVEELTVLFQEHGLVKRYYASTDTFRPNDYLTILTDRELFEPTKYGNRGNRLYRRISAPNELWCLDRKHTGASAHLEVFSQSTKKQINISKVDQINFFRGLTANEKNRNLEMEDMP